MKETELRIGNYVTDQYNVVYSLNKHDLYTLEHSSIEPIQLTEEWLFNLGFKLDGEQINGSYYILQFHYSSGFKDYISISDKGGGYIFSLTSNYDKYSILPLNYKYVHQLQNLYFALTEKELK